MEPVDIVSSALLFILMVLIAAGLVADRHTGWLSSTLIDDAPRRRTRNGRTNRR